MNRLVCWYIGVISALVLIPVGALLTAFGYARYVAEDLGLGRWANPGILALGLIGLHVVPFLLFLLAEWRLGKAPQWLGKLMVVLSPMVGAFGAYPLFVRGDWGDVVLWAPYLFTGVLEAVVGWMILTDRWDA